jgi:hypothetical protein
MNKVFPEKTPFLWLNRYFYLKQVGKTISNVQFYEMDHRK